MGKKGKEKSSRIREGRRQREGKNTQTIHADTRRYDATWRCWKSIPGIRKKIHGNEIACRGFRQIPPRRRSNMRPNKWRGGKGGCISNFHSNARYTCCQRRAAFAMRSFSPSLFLPLYIPTYYAEERQLSRQVFQFFQQGGGQSCGG